MKVKVAVLASLAKYGCIMNNNTPDPPGGTVSNAGTPSSGTYNTVENTGGGPDDSGSSDDSDDNSGGDPEGDSGGDPEGDSGDDSDDQDGIGTSDPPSGDSGIKSLEEKLDNLMSIIGNEGDNDGDNSESLEHDDLVAMMADDPEGFLKNLTEAISKSVRSDISEELANREYDKKIEETILDYAEENPDFEEMWDKGEIQSFLESNPAHNAISAHMYLTMENRIKEAEKRGAEEAMKNYSVKSKNQVLSGGPGIPPNKRDEALRNPEKFGGRAAVLAARAGIM